MRDLLVNEQLLRMTDLANTPAQEARQHTYKSGERKGMVKQLSARSASRGIIGVSANTIWKWIRQGQFPAGLKIGSNTFWRASDIQKWLDLQGQEAAND